MSLGKLPHRSLAVKKMATLERRHRDAYHLAVDMARTVFNGGLTPLAGKSDTKGATPNS